MSEDIVERLRRTSDGAMVDGRYLAFSPSLDDVLKHEAAVEIDRLRAEVAWFEKRRVERLEFASEPAYGPWTIEEVEQLAASLHSEPCPLKRKAIRFTVRHLPNRDDWEWANRTAEYLNLEAEK